MYRPTRRRCSSYFRPTRPACAPPPPERSDGATPPRSPARDDRVRGAEDGYDVRGWGTPVEREGSTEGRGSLPLSATCRSDGRGVSVPGISIYGSASTRRSAGRCRDGRIRGDDGDDDRDEPGGALVDRGLGIDAVKSRRRSGRPEHGVSSPRRCRCRPAVRAKRDVRDRVIGDLRGRGSAGNRRGEIASGSVVMIVPRK